MTRLFQLTGTLAIILASVGSCLASLNVTYEWKYIDYVWQSQDQKAAALEDGTYDSSKIATNDVQQLPDGRVLITTPRFVNNPASLSTISDQIGEGGHLLAPYPDWSWHTRDDCSGITSVNRVYLDDYNRLWLVDSGKIENAKVCEAKILAFNATTDELLLQVEIPDQLSHWSKDPTRGLLEVQAVETSPDCSEVFWVYISDLMGFGMVIWDGSDIWRIEDDIFYPTPEGETLTIGGEDFTILHGLVGISEFPSGFLKQSYVALKPLNNLKTYVVFAEDLHNSKSGSGLGYYVSNFTGTSEQPSKAFGKKNGIVIAFFVRDAAIACWNAQNTLETANTAVLEVNSTTFQYVSSVKTSLGAEGKSETAWLSSFDYTGWKKGTMNPSKANYWVLTGDLDVMVEGTVCEAREHDVLDRIEDKDFSFLKRTNGLVDRFPASA